jgi:putative SOS response-associated peptidase YedK
MRWGIIPSWWSKPLKEMKLATFNARVESIKEKPMFRRAFQRTRYLIPASGYYQWHDASDGKQPYYFTRRDGAPITIAGLWGEWRDRQAGETIRSCAMSITDANEFMGELHDRMPVILEPEQFEAWLTGVAGSELMKPAANDMLQCWPVSRRVNSSRARDDDASLIEAAVLGAGGTCSRCSCDCSTRVRWEMLCAYRPITGPLRPRVTLNGRGRCRPKI